MVQIIKIRPAKVIIQPKKGDVYPNGYSRSTTFREAAP